MYCTPFLRYSFQCLKKQCCELISCLFGHDVNYTKYQLWLYVKVTIIQVFNSLTINVRRYARRYVGILLLSLLEKIDILIE